MVIQASINCVEQINSMYCTAPLAVVDADVNGPVRAYAGKVAGAGVFNRFEKFLDEGIHRQTTRLSRRAFQRKVPGTEDLYFPSCGGIS